MNAIHIHSHGEAPVISMTNYDQGERSWQSVRIKLGGIEVSLMGERGQNLVGELTNALVEGLTNIHHS